MASSRLTDPQKQELVERYSRGEASLALAESYGVSTNTVSRIVKAALPADRYESLKQQRARGAGGLQVASDPQPAASIPDSAAPAAPDSPEAAPIAAIPTETSLAGPPPGGSVSSADEQDDRPQAAVTPAGSRSRRRRSAGAESLPSPSSGPSPEDGSPSSEALELNHPQADAANADRPPEAPRPARPVARRTTAAAPIPSRSDPRADSDPGVLAIDDADDFSNDLSDDDFDAADDGGEGMDPFTPIAVSLHALGGALAGTEAVTCRPLTTASLNGGVYMLVDKTVELQPRPLSEFSELGALPAEEADRQAISLFINPREAKRQCGRSQRVIKMPDPRLLERTAPFLLAQGISRVVIEGALYALPGS